MAREDLFVQLQTLIFEDCYKILRSPDLTDEAKASLFKPFERFGITESQKIDEAFQVGSKEVDVSNAINLMRCLKDRSWTVNLCPNLQNNVSGSDDTPDHAETFDSIGKDLDLHLLNRDLNLLDQEFMTALMIPTGSFKVWEENDQYSTPGLYTKAPERVRSRLSGTDYTTLE